MSQSRSHLRSKQLSRRKKSFLNETFLSNNKPLNQSLNKDIRKNNRQLSPSNRSFLSKASHSSSKLCSQCLSRLCRRLQLLNHSSNSRLLCPSSKLCLNNKPCLSNSKLLHLSHSQFSSSRVPFHLKIWPEFRPNASNCGRKRKLSAKRRRKRRRRKKKKARRSIMA